MHNAKYFAPVVMNAFLGAKRSAAIVAAAAQRPTRLNGSLCECALLPIDRVKIKRHIVKSFQVEDLFVLDTHALKRRSSNNLCCRWWRRTYNAAARKQHNNGVTCRKEISAWS